MAAATVVQEAEPILKRYEESILALVRHQFVEEHLVRFKAGRKLPVIADVAAVVPHQTERDIEQFQYLLDQGVLDPDKAQYVREQVLPHYQSALEAVRRALEGRHEPYFALRYDAQYRSFFSLHQRALHLNPGNIVPGEAIRPRDFGAVEEEFMESEHRVAVMDDFLSEEALQRLRDFLMESTFWFDPKKGYVGTYLHTAFASPLVAQIDEELRMKFPKLLGGLELTNAWAFMYEGSLGGINTHADNCQVQINMFLTPTEANLWVEDPTQPSGGLVIYGIGPPDEWEFLRINQEGENQHIDELIASTGNWNRTIPYVQNRAVLFDSTYFHRTDEMCFRNGYKNRRINVTFLYGKRADLVPAKVMRHES